MGLKTVTAPVNVDLEKPSTYSLTIDDCSAADIDLAQQVGYAPICPQRMRVHNSGASTEAFEGVDSGGKTITLQLGPNETDYVLVPMRSVDASECGSDVSAVAYYWPSGVLEVNT